MKKFVGILLSFFVMVVSVALAGIVIVFDAINALSGAIVGALSDMGYTIAKKVQRWIDDNFQFN